MSNPAFIVDGFTEKNVLSKICPGRPVSRTDLNGKAVTIPAIANKIYSLIKIFNNKYYPIIILIDRENRQEDCDTIRLQLENELNKKGLNNQDIRINVADRMFENWIVADWNVLNSVNPKPANTDGCNGASLIKKELGSFHKTTDGVELFVKANQKEMYLNSPSFKAFVDKSNNINCDYLNF
ncbi:DUF4276 family protein [Flavobacterium sp. DG1-102-2]|uniref:DUF4276 family protein n=1 Tax=Flavobacterium sp. DG1-102-2 TaxID=3081663 RepID=UPI00294A0330|nr:DUF4276 family protein [Flavobacterium sp. DG1-102-2]MDV6170181.1 DUF4276 family protein [Flavobacterium sp. DG1-102-2]